MEGWIAFLKRVGGWTQHIGLWAKSSLREIAHRPICNNAAVGSRKGR